MRNAVLIGLISLLSIISVQAEPVSSSEEIDSIVAVVNNDVITRRELNERFQLVTSEFREQHPNEPFPDQAEKQVLEQMINENIQTQMAEKMGIRIDDQAVFDAVQRIAEQNKLSFEQFKTKLERKGYSFPSFQKQVQRELAISQVQQQHILRRIGVTEQEINHFLASTPSLLEHIQYQIAHLAIPQSVSEPDILQCVEELKAGKNLNETLLFQNILKTTGSPLTWQELPPKHVKELPTLFAEKVLEMKVGDISAPLKSAESWHIIKLKGISASDPHLVQLVHVRHILVKPTLIRGETEIKEQLSHLRERILKGEDFSGLAKLYSQDILTARQGGDLQWIEPASLGELFEKAIQTLAPSEVTLPFRTEQGWHIAQVLERKTEDVTIEHRRHQAEESIRRKKFNDALQNWLIEIREQAFVDIR